MADDRAPTPLRDMDGNVMPTRTGKGREGTLNQLTYSVSQNEIRTMKNRENQMELLRQIEERNKKKEQMKKKDKFEELRLDKRVRDDLKDLSFKNN